MTIPGHVRKTIHKQEQDPSQDEDNTPHDETATAPLADAKGGSTLSSDQPSNSTKREGTPEI